jgi:hypothetical protein
VRLWDTLLADPSGRVDCLLRLCIAMLVHIRAELLAVSTYVMSRGSTTLHLCDMPIHDIKGSLYTFGTLGTWCLVLQGDFSANLKLLQSFPSVDVRDVLRTAQELSSLEGV